MACPKIRASETDDVGQVTLRPASGRFSRVPPVVATTLILSASTGSATQILTGGLLLGVLTVGHRLGDWKQAF
ncbi:hypothetical protein FHU29_004545 [Hoyosella altamirensis]|uniref:Uncharacterized protein n=1 Tax=Hoyosella altamirensis TaxID=616997 RepID=A0A839RU20_9ACTN|nr:hypothetical protein [Hoyosella altamirensis]